MQLLLESDNYGERRGAAYGLAGLVRGLGITALKQLEIMSTLEQAVKDKKNPRRREGRCNDIARKPVKLISLLSSCQRRRFNVKQSNDISYIRNFLLSSWLPWNRQKQTQWKINPSISLYSQPFEKGKFDSIKFYTPSKNHFCQNFLTRKFPVYRIFCPATFKFLLKFWTWWRISCLWCINILSLYLVNTGTLLTKQNIFTGKMINWRWGPKRGSLLLLGGRFF